MTRARPVLLLTRPREAADRFAAQVGPGRWRVVIAPLMRIDHLETHIDLAGIRGLIFTSVNGVAAFARLTERRDLPAWTVGETTAQAARDIGLDARMAGVDAAALLVALRADPPAGPLLHLRGEHARGEVAQKLTRAGTNTRAAVLYRQVPLPMAPDGRACLETPGRVVVPLFSPRSAALLRDAAARPAARLHVVAMSDAVADQLGALPVERLTICAVPDLAAMLAGVRAELDAALRLEGWPAAQ